MRKCHFYFYLFLSFDFFQMSLVKSKNCTHSTSTITARLYLINFIFLEKKIFQFLSSGFQNIFLLLAFCIIKQFVNSSHAERKKWLFWIYKNFQSFTKAKCFKMSSELQLHLLGTKSALPCPHQICGGVFKTLSNIYHESLSQK